MQLGTGAAAGAGLGVRHGFHKQMENACLGEGWRRWEHLEGGEDCLARLGLAGMATAGEELGSSHGVGLWGEVPAEQLRGVSLVKCSQILLLLGCHLSSRC